MSDTLLRSALRGNALFSAVSSAVLLIGGSWLAEWLGVAAPIVYIVGVGLIPWAGFAGWTSRTLKRWAVAAIILGDLIWVVGSVVVIVGWHDELTSAGVVGIICIAIVVAGFAAAQTMGLRQLTADG